MGKRNSSMTGNAVKGLIALTSIAVMLMGIVPTLNGWNGNLEIIKEIEKVDIQSTYFELYINEQLVGSVPSKSVVAALITKAKESVCLDIGYEPEFEYTIRVEEKRTDDLSVSDEALVVSSISEALCSSLSEIKVKAFVMKIDDFRVVLKDEADLIKTLEGAQYLYVQDDSAISVKLVQDEHNGLILTPEVQILQKELPEERIFVTSEMFGEPMEDLEADESQFLEAVVQEVRLDQEIIIVEAFVSEEEIVDIESATEMITKEHEEEKTYKVVKGDSPSVIAVSNNMTTEALYELNPGLKENARRMQIGDELTIMVPEPELFVTTVEDVIYTQIIDRDKIYVNDPDAYIGTFETITEGSDGIIEVRATVEKLNGKIIDQEIYEETVILEPVTEKLYRGIKALPVTTATGTFEMPMLTYTYTSGYGYRWGRTHKGIDLAAPTGTSIKASDGGRIIQAGWDGGYGYSVEIDHGKGLVTKYAHCSAIYVTVGEEVSQYQTIAAVGNTGNSTGPHLHFEIRKNGVPKDPMLYLD